ncbi:conserved exported hypothetical protein [Burkholderiales bacterium]|nr:conserved exported hypothetical protein [Burkholderiales bacterium]
MDIGHAILCRMRQTCGLGLLFLVVAGKALAQDSEAAALGLADTAPVASAVSRSWRLYVEEALEQVDMHFGLADERLHRSTLDLQIDKTLEPGWRLVFADRLDLGDVPNFAGVASTNQVNTLKEAYVSWAAQTNVLLDAGRINPRLGVATGYNPTDVFRDDALRSVDSSDPVSLRENRMGSVMLRGQTLWVGGSLTALISPKLAEQPNSAGYSLDIGATNHELRWMLVGSEQLSESINPQLLIWGDQGGAPQIGLNLTGLLSDAAVAYLEYFGGRSPSLAAEAMLRGNDTAYRSRLAGGITYTFANKLSWTAEYEFSGAGMNKEQWQLLQRGPVDMYVAYREFGFNAQDMVTRRAAFVSASWQDAGVRNLDLQAWTKFDLIDDSRLIWLEARYHWTRAEAAVQRQVNAGATLSDYGALPQARVWTVLFRYYF